MYTIQRISLIFIILLLCNIAHSSTPCGTINTATELRSLLILSNFNTVKHIQHIPDRLDEISAIFAKAGDRRGLFPTIYAPVSRYSLDYLDNLPKATRLPLSKAMWYFAEQYFLHLQHHLMGQPIPIYWKMYYLSAFHCEINPLLTTSYGLLAHISFDLKTALIKSQITDGAFPDYLALGNALTATKASISQRLWERYQLNILPLLDGLWAGKTLNALSQKGNFSTLLTFNALRTEAWMSSRAQHYSLGFFDNMIEQGQLVLWQSRVQMLYQLQQLGIY